MKISRLVIKPYRFPLSSPLVNANQSFRSRVGYVIWLFDSESNCGLGEVAPLPGFSQETYQQAGQNLKKLSALIDAGKVESTNDSYHPLQFPAGVTILPSVQFGLESAANDLMARKQQMTFRSLFNPDSKDSITVNGLIGLSSVSDCVKQAKTLVNDGFTTIKIKIGRPDFSEDLHVLKSIKRASKDLISLRLDANQAWAPEEALANISQLEQLNIEYVEQPIAPGDVESLLHIRGHTSIPLAVDEELRNYTNAETVVRQKAADVIVIKPQIFGSYSKLFSLITLARQKEIKVVFSSAMESRIGDSTAIQLAAAFAPDAVHGLNLDQFFATPLGSMDSYFQKSGRIALPAESGLALNYQPETLNIPE